MFSDTCPPDNDGQQRESSRPSVSSKCLSNLRSIVSQNVSMNNHQKHASSVNKPHIIQTPPVPMPTLPRPMQPAQFLENFSNGINEDDNRRKARQSLPHPTAYVEYSDRGDERKSFSPTQKRSYGNYQTSTISIVASTRPTYHQEHYDEIQSEESFKKSSSKVQSTIPTQASSTGRFSSGNATTFKHKGLSIGASIPLRIPVHPPPSAKPVAHGFPSSSIKPMQTTWYKPKFIEPPESKPIELPIYRHESSPSSLSVNTSQRTGSETSANNSLNKSFDSSNSSASVQSQRSTQEFRQHRPRMHTQHQPISHGFGQFTRLPMQLRNQTPSFQPSPQSQPIRPSRRSYPHAASTTSSYQNHESTSRIPAEAFDCCQSQSSSSSKERHTTRRRATHGNHQQQELTTTEKNLVESEARSNYFRQVEKIRDVMVNVAQRLTRGLPPSMSIPVVDTHCHFDLIFERLRIKHNDLTRYFRDYSEFYPAGLSFELAIQVFWRPKHLTEDNWNDWYSKYLDDDRVYGSCGIHPHWSASWSDTCIEDIERCLTHPKVVALGEIGLDFGPKNECTAHEQRRAFEEQLKIAAKWFKPIVIHSRDAYKETFQLMKHHLRSDHRIHLHCFVGTLNDVDLFTSYFTEIKFGFTPIISRTQFLHPVLQQLELTQILSETDSPYFMPDELSIFSRCAHPGMVYSVIETIAQLRYLPVIDVARQLRENARHMYGF